MQKYFHIRKCVQSSFCVWIRRLEEIKLWKKCVTKYSVSFWNAMVSFVFTGYVENLTEVLVVYGLNVVSLLVFYMESNVKKKLSQLLFSVFWEQGWAMLFRSWVKMKFFFILIKNNLQYYGFKSFIDHNQFCITFLHTLFNLTLFNRTGWGSTFCGFFNLHSVSPCCYLEK